MPTNAGSLSCRATQRGRGSLNPAQTCKAATEHDLCGSANQRTMANAILGDGGARNIIVHDDGQTSMAALAVAIRHCFHHRCFRRCSRRRRFASKYRHDLPQFPALLCLTGRHHCATQTQTTTSDHLSVQVQLRLMPSGQPTRAIPLRRVPPHPPQALLRAFPLQPASPAAPLCSVERATAPALVHLHPRPLCLAHRFAPRLAHAPRDPETGQGYALSLPNPCPRVSRRAAQPAVRCAPLCC
mmetsp:Transcript_32386/g.67650  ORF Transcript_32386/g.67650 Transcript_32386/m.67650 type:complete len:242 (+) Transcript_32386:447-1172(+)